MNHGSVNSAKLFPGKITMQAGSMSCSSGRTGVNYGEIVKLERYLQRVFRLPAIEVKQRPRKEDSAEVYVGDEFIGVLFRDDDEGETAYQFQMAILDYDLGS